MKGTAPKSFLKRPPWRTIIPGISFLLALLIGYWLWSPGLDVRDGRHDRDQNGIWIGHGWLAGDKWFIQNKNTNQIARFRDTVQIRKLAEKLRRHHVTDVFPHLCPVELHGKLPAVDSEQTERFLDEFTGFKVMPWIGGPSGAVVRLYESKWRAEFAKNVRALLMAHPRFAGIHLNVEPLTSGDTNFLQLLTDLRAALPPDKIISVAAYPPPTRWHPFEDAHWDEAYFREVSRHVDQLVVMMYDAGQHNPKTYVKLMADWTPEVLTWSSGKSVLLGIPTYEDPGVEYHYANVENITNALLGIHRGLSRQALPTNYQGVAIYCEWETSDSEWQYFQEHFLKPAPASQKQ
jgi:hypothetical protein